MSGAVRRVVCGMSGGVDSTVSAMMLKKRGYEVVGAFMRNWDLADETGHCGADRDAEEAERVCKKLDIPFREVNLVKQYWSEVFTSLVADYERGLTPNPDVVCNGRIKFAHFHKFCFDQVGCDAVATGHYARNSYGEDLEYAGDGTVDARLLKSADLVKDQTFFLARIEQSALRRSMFPVGGLTKDVVKAVARAEGFPEIAAKKESMGICFIGKRSFQNFISEYVDDRPGDIVDIDDGRTLGRHHGLHHWTVGQRLNLRISGEGMFVAGKDVASNRLLACSDTDHPALFCEHFFCRDPKWIRTRPPGELRRATRRSMECQFRVQNVQPLTNCVVSLSMVPSAPGGRANHESLDQQCLTVSSAEPKRAVTPGQFAVFYRGDECLGSAVIDRPGPSLLTMAGTSNRAAKETS